MPNISPYHPSAGRGRYFITAKPRIVLARSGSWSSRMLPSSGSAFDVRQFANPDRHDPDLAETPLRDGALTEGAPQVAG